MGCVGIKQVNAALAWLIGLLELSLDANTVVSLESINARRDANFGRDFYSLVKGQCKICQFKEEKKRKKEKVKAFWSNDESSSVLPTVD